MSELLVKPNPAPAIRRPEELDSAQKQRQVHRIFSTIAEGYDQMNDVESFRLHRAWKRALLDRVAAVRPRRVLDVACGTGDIALALSQRLPECEVVALDFCEPMLAVARRRAREQPDKRDGGFCSHLPQFVQGDAMHLPFPDGNFDAVTISFGLRNMPDYAQVVAEMTRVIKPGGLFCCLEASYPTNPAIVPFFRLYFKHIMPRLGAAVAGHRDEYQWLNDSTEAFLTKPALVELMRECGLAGVRYRSFLFGSAALHVGKKPGA
ncbi:MAG: bifunctional demethylmenaquinone methyltransferase/2-methoxy-6-polyprenyl-1,4-benzoquinol methylase UbiE [Coriobacteriales bacterium]|jgi:demethylmenaquinone methyltransferase/2-methoxy-6-polyprenyl-1,4-benzoquinol methylase|nr:bifunctional demethylmenaquinone methyltransferase/2-methoxy-6-polyprenyl-1,4-benzoquinol methylase UbiE [Coriobacteriales bacterium]